MTFYTYFYIFSFIGEIISLVIGVRTDNEKIQNACAHICSTLILGMIYAGFGFLISLIFGGD